MRNKVIDISIPIQQQMHVWPNEHGISIQTTSNQDITVSIAKLGLHCGTHLDAPYHFLENGKKLSDYPLKRFHGKVDICEIENPSAITLTELKTKLIQPQSKVLFKTANSRLWEKNKFDKNFIGLELDAAEHLIQRGINLIGADYLSIESFHSKDNPVHRTLLAADVLILEGLNLQNVPEGNYELACFPLYIQDTEACPTRAVLFQR